MKVTYQYPSDPVSEAELMFGETFLRRNPVRQTVIGTEHEVLAVIPAGDEIICDSCNALVEWFDPCAISQDRLYCWPCFKKWIQPFILKRGE